MCFERKHHSLYLFYVIEWCGPALTLVALHIKLHRDVGLHSVNVQWELQYIKNCNTCIQSLIV